MITVIKKFNSLANGDFIKGDKTDKFNKKQEDDLIAKGYAKREAKKKTKK